MDGQKSYQILYFSGTGNTEYVVKEIQKSLIAKRQKCELLAADKLWAACGRRPQLKGETSLAAGKLAEFLKSAAVLILAYPVYASDIPKPLDQLISLLPDAGGIKLAVVATCAAAGGDGCLLPARKLKNKGYQCLLAAYVKMPNNIKLPFFNYFSIRNGKELDRFYSSASMTIDKITEKLTEQKRYLSGRSIFSLGLGWIQRFAEKFMANFINKRMFAAENCTKCKLCMASCPMENITFENDRPKFGSNCCFCLRCYNFCPVSAIQITEKTRNKKIYTRYNGFNDWEPSQLYDI